MTSREIAELTGKEHKNVMADIRKMMDDISFASADFLADLPDGYGRMQPVFILDKELTMTLVAGYSASLRYKIIKRWQELESTAANSLAVLPPEQRALVALMLDNAAIKAKQAEQDAALAAQAEAIKRIESNQVAAVASVQSFTALGYSLYRDLGLSKIELNKLGRKASAISKARGLTVDQVSDGRYGRVGSYHIAALDAALEEMMK
jgi:phage regulator Rha-like protein